MALGIEAIRNALRLGNTAEETSEATRLQAVADALVSKHAPNAPEVVRDEATIRIAAYLFDQPNAGRGAAFAHALRNSGAQSLLVQWRVHGAGLIGDTEDDEMQEEPLGPYRDAFEVTLDGIDYTRPYGFTLAALDVGGSVTYRTVGGTADQTASLEPGQYLSGPAGVAVLVQVVRASSTLRRFQVGVQ